MNVLARTYFAPQVSFMVSPLRSVSWLSTNTPAWAEGSLPFEMCCRFVIEPSKSDFSWRA